MSSNEDNPPGDPSNDPDPMEVDVSTQLKESSDPKPTDSSSRKRRAEDSEGSESLRITRSRSRQLSTPGPVRSNTSAGGFGVRVLRSRTVPIRSNPLSTSRPPSQGSKVPKISDSPSATRKVVGDPERNAWIRGIAENPFGIAPGILSSVLSSPSQPDTLRAVLSRLQDDPDWEVKIREIVRRNIAARELLNRMNLLGIASVPSSPGQLIILGRPVRSKKLEGNAEWEAMIWRSIAARKLFKDRKPVESKKPAEDSEATATEADPLKFAKKRHVTNLKALHTHLDRYSENLESEDFNDEVYVDQLVRLMNHQMLQNRIPEDDGAMEVSDGAPRRRTDPEDPNNGTDEEWAAIHKENIAYLRWQCGLFLRFPHWLKLWDPYFVSNLVFEADFKMMRIYTWNYERMEDPGTSGQEESSGVAPETVPETVPSNTSQPHTSEPVESNTSAGDSAARALQAPDEPTTSAPPSQEGSSGVAPVPSSSSEPSTPKCRPYNRSEEDDEWLAMVRRFGARRRAARELLSQATPFGIAYGTPIASSSSQASTSGARATEVPVGFSAKKEALQKHLKSYSENRESEDFNDMIYVDRLVRLMNRKAIQNRIKSLPEDDEEMEIPEDRMSRCLLKDPINITDNEMMEVRREDRQHLQWQCGHFLFCPNCAQLQDPHFVGHLIREIDFKMLDIHTGSFHLWSNDESETDTTRSQESGTSGQAPPVESEVSDEEDDEEDEEESEGSDDESGGSDDDSGGSERAQRTGGSSSQPSTSGPNEPAEHAEGSERIGRSSKTATSRQPSTRRSRESNRLAQLRMFGARRAAAKRQILSRINPFASGIPSSVPSSSSQPSTSGIVYGRPSSGRSGRSSGMPPRTSSRRFNDPSEGSSSSSTSTRKVTRSAAREVDEQQHEQKRQLAVEHVLGDLLPQETLRTHRYPKAQTDILIAEYERNQSPDNAVYKRLAKQLGWKPGKVRKWFTNRRNREKRKQEEERRKSH